MTDRAPVTEEHMAMLRKVFAALDLPVPQQDYAVMVDYDKLAVGAYLLGLISSTVLANVEDGAFEEWIDALREMRGGVRHSIDALNTTVGRA